MKMDNTDFKIYPKFRHNLWTTYEDDAEVTYLTLSHGTFEVTTQDASRFLKIRAFCTGHHTITDIAEKSSMSSQEVLSIVNSMQEIEAFHLPYKPLQGLAKEEVLHTLEAATNIWAEQLADTYISRDIFSGKTSKNVVLGWLLETYHYVKLFPTALEVAAKHASGRLKELLHEYAKQEQGHEQFILQSLLKAGLSRQEVESSIPLISTRTIDLLLKELFSFEPATVLLVASIIEADDFNEGNAQEIAKILHDTHEFPLDMLMPFFDHVNVDFKFGHHQLLQNNRVFLEEINFDHLHDVVNKLHDIKHAFDLQKLEILEYYNKLGNYLPRQYVSFFSI